MNLTENLNYTEAELVVAELMEFETRDLCNLLSYFIMSLIGMMSNTWVLIIAGRQAKRPDIRTRTNVHYLVYHLTIADAITCFVTLPMETIWRATIQWYAGNFVCKVLMMARTGGFILSSNMLVVLSIDRYISISNPLSSLNTARQRRRARLMVVLAWLTTLLFSSPQAVIFRVMKHPQADFYQCTTWNFFEGFASNVTEGNTTRLLLPGGMTPTQAADLYHTLFNCEVFFAPVIAIIASYSKIFFVISRRTTHVLTHFSQNAEENRSNKNKKKSLMKALKMSIIHVVVFVLSWTPYSVMATWDTVDKKSAQLVPGAVQDILYLTAVFNSCLNPLIYGIYYHSEQKKSSHSRSATSRTFAHLPELSNFTCEGDLAENFPLDKINSNKKCVNGNNQY